MAPEPVPFARGRAGISAVALNVACAHPIGRASEGEQHAQQCAVRVAARVAGRDLLQIGTLEQRGDVDDHHVLIGIRPIGDGGAMPGTFDAIIVGARCAGSLDCEFGAVFKCAAQTPMNTGKQCSVW